jgi:predicted AAA+ superfamily ATPase
VRERRHPKLYWIDSGLVRVLKRQLGDVAREEEGSLREGLVAIWLRAYGEYVGTWDDISYWASADGLEVDFLVRRGKMIVAIEVKSSPNVRPEDMRGLSAIAQLSGVVRRILVYGGHSRLIREDGIEVLPIEGLADQLAGDLFKAS